MNSAQALEEIQLPNRFTTEILPFFESAKKGSFAGKDGVSIAWRAFPPANGSGFQGARAIVILPGRAEPMRKYAELVYDLQKTNSAIYIMDLRGQGESGRMLDEPRAGYVKNFQDYVDDLDSFLNQVIRPNQPSQIHVIAHSLGGAVATAYAIQHPDALTSMALSAPMYLPNMGKFTEAEAFFLAAIMRLFGKDTDMAPGKHLDDWKPHFATNGVTHSESRYQNEQEIYRLHPETIVGGPTYRWVQEALRGDRFIRDNADKLITPTRILESGADRVVINYAEEDVCSAAKNCELYAIPDSKHSALNEVDNIRNVAIAKSLEWIDHHP